MTESRATYAAGGPTVGGWRIHQVYLTTGQVVIVNPAPKSLTWCREMVKLLTDDNDVGDCEYSILPVGGWESVDADPLAAIICRVALGELSPELALVEIRRLTAQSAGVVGK